MKAYIFEVTESKMEMISAGINKAEVTPEGKLVLYAETDDTVYRINESSINAVKVDNDNEFVTLKYCTVARNEYPEHNVIVKAGTEIAEWLLASLVTKSILPLDPWKIDERKMSDVVTAFVHDHAKM